MISNTNFIEGFILNLKTIYKFIQMAYMIANTNFTMSSNSFSLEKKTSRLLFSKMSFQSITLQLSCLRLIPASSSNSRYASVRFNDGSISTASYRAVLLRTTGRVGCDADGKHSKVPSIPAYVSLRKWALSGDSAMAENCWHQTELNTFVFPLKAP